MKPKNYWLEKWKEKNCLQTSNTFCYKYINCNDCPHNYDWDMVFE